MAFINENQLIFQMAVIREYFVRIRSEFTKFRLIYMRNKIIDASAVTPREFSIDIRREQ